MPASSAPKLPPHVRTALLCTDVIKDVNNKITVIGIFTNDIRLSRIPGQLRLCIYVEYMSPKTATEQVNFRIKYGGEEVVRLEGRLEGITRGATAPIVVGPFDMIAEVAGELAVDLEVGGSGYKPLFRKDVAVGEVNSFAIMEPPAAVTPAPTA